MNDGFVQDGTAAASSPEAQALLRELTDASPNAIIAYDRDERVIFFNPAYPESVMLVILFMNVVGPTIDHFAVQANIRRRLARRG